MFEFLMYVVQLFFWLDRTSAIASTTETAEAILHLPIIGGCAEISGNNPHAYLRGWASLEKGDFIIVFTTCWSIDDYSLQPF
jgi:hypothetical protein